MPSRNRDTQTRIELAAGEALFREGEMGDVAYIVQSGRLEVFITRGGDEQRLAVRGSDEVVGEMALIDARPRSASVRALEPCVLLVITSEAVQRRLQQVDPITRLCLEVVMRRCREMVTGVVESRGPTYASAVQTLARENEIRRGLADNEFVLFYQPIVELGSGALAGFEGLMRWRPPGRDTIGPAAFIPQAEMGGLICQITAVALQEAQTFYPLLRAAGELSLGAAPFLSINVSCEDLVSEDFGARLAAVASSLGPAASGLKLEVTESGLMHDAPKARAALDACRKLGVGVAIDDFGTGYSSLSYLATLPITTLKIDRSFVQSLDDKTSRKIVHTVLRLAGELEIPVVAEGVETADQAETLSAMGCRFAQGYLFGRPTDLKASLAVIGSWRSRQGSAAGTSGESPSLRGKIA